MRILWLKIGGLWPPNAGGRLRTFHTLRELSRRHEVTLLTTHTVGDDPEGLRAALPSCVRVISFPHVIAKRGTLSFARVLARSWMSELPADLLRCCVPALQKEAERCARETNLTVVDFLAAAPNAPWNASSPLILFEHNVEYVIWQRLKNESRGWRRALLELEWRKMRRYEREASSRVRLTIAVSELDRARLEELAPGANVRAVSTGVDTDYFQPGPSPEEPGRLVFTGSMDWYPNEDGVLYFLEAIFPDISREMPGASLTVVGRNPPPRLQAENSRDGVLVTGTVADIRKYVQPAAVYVVPLRIGGGTRLKIFEALAMGKAVVSTTVGAEGLPLEPGRHFIVADRPSDFAREVVALLRDPVRRRALGQEGRKLVEERFSWSQVAREFEKLCSKIVDDRPTTR